MDNPETKVAEEAASVEAADSKSAAANKPIKKLALPIIVVVVLVAIAARFFLGGYIQDRLGYGTDPKGKVGQTVTVDNVKVTLDTVTHSQGNDLYQPSEGKEYVLCQLTIHNGRKEPLTVSSALCFSAHFDARDIPVSLDAMLCGEAPQIDTEIASGDTFTGVVGFHVEPGWKQLHLVYNLDGIGDYTADFTVPNN